MTDSISDEFERALAELCTDERVRAVEAGAHADATHLWAAIDTLGYTEALVPAVHGGAGLALDEACPLLMAAGHAGLNHPFGETMLVRALLRTAGWQPDGACIAIAQALPAANQAIVCREVSGARLSQHVLVEWQDAWLLMPVASASVVPGSFRPHASASLRWTSAQQAMFRCARGAETAESLCSVVHAAAMAGAMARILELSVRYANDRRQFGKAIGQFQAIQQDLAVLAEQASAAAIGARIGCAVSAARPDPLLAAVAKLRACKAGAKVTALAHAVHGAIGITEEHMLGVFTTRLHEWRSAPGSELRSAELLGHAVLSGTSRTFGEFVGARLSPAPAMAAA